MCNIEEFLHCMTHHPTGEAGCWMKSPQPFGSSTCFVISHHQQFCVAFFLFKTLRLAFTTKHPQCNLKENSFMHILWILSTLLSIRILWESVDHISESCSQRVIFQPFLIKHLVSAPVQCSEGALSLYLPKL